MNETFIFHETQEGLLCGQHCLNNLLQQSLFTAVDLSDIAIQLDTQEREIYANGSRRSGISHLQQ
jgi:ataxin-3